MQLQRRGGSRHRKRDEAGGENDNDSEEAEGSSDDEDDDDEDAEISSSDLEDSQESEDSESAEGARDTMLAMAALDDEEEKEVGDRRVFGKTHRVETLKVAESLSNMPLDEDDEDDAARAASPELRTPKNARDNNAILQDLKRSDSSPHIGQSPATGTKE